MAMIVQLCVHCLRADKFDNLRGNPAYNMLRKVVTGMAARLCFDLGSKVK